MCFALLYVCVCVYVRVCVCVCVRYETKQPTCLYATNKHRNPNNIKIKQQLSSFRTWGGK